MKNVKELILLSLLFGLIVTGCERDNKPPDQVDIDLKAFAGDDQEVYMDVPVILKGSATGAPEPVNFRWRFISRPAFSTAVIEDHENDTARFTPDVPGLYVVELETSKYKITSVDQTNITALESSSDVIVISENISEDRILEDVFDDPYVPDYLVTKELTVTGKLTVRPGVFVQFEKDAGLMISTGGALVSKGTAENMIIYTGKEAVEGFWKGILLLSNSPLNELEYTSVSFGGGSPFTEEPGLSANVIIAGNNFSGGAAKISRSVFDHSGSYGLYLRGAGQLNTFSNNTFSDNNSAAAWISPGQLHMLDPESDYSMNNNYNGIETGGELNLGESLVWSALAGGSKYLISSDLKIKMPLAISEGAVFEVKPGLMIEISETGFLDTRGSEGKPVVFTAQNQTPGGNWMGILFKSQDSNNKLNFAEVSFAGSHNFPGITNKANIAVAPTGSLSVTNSRIHDGPGYGIVSSFAYQLNPDIYPANEFFNLTEGVILPSILMTPDAPPLEGEWVDWWSFIHGHMSVDTVLYNRTANVWFHGASDPWHMNPQQGFGLKISANGNYTWTMAERHDSDTQCTSYSVEYMKGYQTYTETQLMVTQEYWRSRFVNSCAPDQNVDTDIETGSVVMEYQINKLHNDLTGEDYWELKLTPPGNPGFSYYRSN